MVQEKDFKDLTVQRVMRKMELWKHVATTFRSNPTQEDEKYWNDLFSDYLLKEWIIRLSDQIERYYQKHGANYGDDVREAKTDNNRLFRIISWDKQWLYVDWVKEKIIAAQESRDYGFMKDLGAAVAREPGSYRRLNEDEDNRKRLIDFMQYAISHLAVTDPNRNIRQFIKDVHKLFNENGMFPDDSFSDLEYFFTFLKRHAVI